MEKKIFNGIIWINNHLPERVKNKHENKLKETLKTLLIDEVFYSIEEYRRLL